MAITLVVIPSNKWYIVYVYISCVSVTAGSPEPIFLLALPFNIKEKCNGLKVFFIVKIQMYKLYSKVGR
jgi:hypothetical protein